MALMSASVSWYEEILVGASIALIGTHVLLLPAFVLSIRYRLALSAEQVLVTAVASFVYHTCLAFSQCAAGLSLWFVTRLDHVCAISLLSRVVLQQTMLVVPRAGPAFRSYRLHRPGITDRMLADDLYWSQFFAYMLTFIAVYLFFSWDPTATFFPTIAMIAITAILASFKVVLLAPKVQTADARKRFATNWKFFGAGVALMLASVAFYASPEYVFSHNGWHIASFVGYTLVQYSYTRVTQIEPGKEQAASAAPLTANTSEKLAHTQRGRARLTSVVTHPYGVGANTAPRQRSTGTSSKTAHQSGVSLLPPPPTPHQ